MENNTFETQWSQYATSKASSKPSRLANSSVTVGGVLAATGAAVFSLSSHASAAIIGSTTPTTLTFNTAAKSVSNFVLNITAPGIQIKGYGGVNSFGGVQALQGNFLTNGAASHGVKKLAFGSAIGGVPGQVFLAAKSAGSFGEPLRVQTKSGAHVSGSFDTGKNEFLGFKLSNGDYGYIELAINNDGAGVYSATPDSLTVVGYAYDNTGLPILAGEPLSSVPEASNTATALLLLACAGGSLTSWRRRKQAVVPDAVTA